MCANHPEYRAHLNPEADVAQDLADGGLSLAHESSVLPDACVIRGLALPGGISDGGRSLAYDSSVLPDACIIRGLVLPGSFSDGGRSLAYESAVLLDTSVTCGLTSPSGISGAGVVSPISRSPSQLCQVFPSKHSVRQTRAVHAVVVDQRQSDLTKQQCVI